MRARSPIVSLLVAFHLSSCANHTTVGVPPPPDAIKAQIAALSSSLSQADPADSLKRHGKWIETTRLELLKEGREFRYEQLLNRDTNAVFGFVYRDDELVSLLSAERTNQLWQCLTPFNLELSHWSQVSMSRLHAWSAQHSIAGVEGPLAQTGTLSQYEDSSSSASSHRSLDSAAASFLTLVVYSPFLLVTLPFYLFSDEQERQNANRRRVEQEVEALELLQLGQRAAPNFPVSHSRDIGEMSVFEPESRRFAYGLRAGSVVMIESPSLQEVFERITRHGTFSYKRNDCPELLPRRSSSSTDSLPAKNNARSAPTLPTR